MHFTDNPLIATSGKKEKGEVLITPSIKAEQQYYFSKSKLRKGRERMNNKMQMLPP